MELMRIFGLQYGAVDFRVTPEGEHVFLEVNPAGEFLFISRRTGQPIAEAVAAALEREDRARRKARPC
jgi:D-alanine-D-alanine ligase-like ATP-grasp enzyme